MAVDELATQGAKALTGIINQYEEQRLTQKQIETIPSLIGIICIVGWLL